jgi:hypothetical protein
LSDDPWTLLQARYHAPRTLRTRVRGSVFDVSVGAESGTITPASSGRERVLRKTEVLAIWPSLQARANRSEWQHLTENGSYLEGIYDDLAEAGLVTTTPTTALPETLSVAETPGEYGATPTATIEVSIPPMTLDPASIGQFATAELRRLSGLIESHPDLVVIGCRVLVERVVQQLWDREFPNASRRGSVAEQLDALRGGRSLPDKDWHLVKTMYGRASRIAHPTNETVGANQALWMWLTSSWLCQLTARLPPPRDLLN